MFKSDSILVKSTAKEVLKAKDSKEELKYVIRMIENEIRVVENEIESFINADLIDITSGEKYMAQNLKDIKSDLVYLLDKAKTFMAHEIKADEYVAKEKAKPIQVAATLNGHRKSEFEQLQDALGISKSDIIKIAVRRLFQDCYDGEQLETIKRDLKDSLSIN